MTQLKKFLFDNFVIDAPRKKEKSEINEMIEENIVVEVEKTEVFYSQDELDSKIEEAKKNSYKQGFEACKQEEDNTIRHLLENIGQNLESLLKSDDNVAMKFEQQFLELGIEILHKLVPTLKEQESTNIIKQFLKDNFVNFSKEKKLSFYLNPDKINEIGEEIGKLANKFDFEGKISIHKDSNLAFCDCRIEWDSGGLMKDSTITQNNIEEFFKGEQK